MTPQEIFQLKDFIAAVVADSAQAKEWFLHVDTVKRKAASHFVWVCSQEQQAMLVILEKQAVESPILRQVKDFYYKNGFLLGRLASLLQQPYENAFVYAYSQLNPRSLLTQALQNVIQKADAKSLLEVAKSYQAFINTVTVLNPLFLLRRG